MEKQNNMKKLKIFNGKEYDSLVSVIIPLYKSFDQSRVQISIDSLKQQQRVNLEIVVAEQSDQPTFNQQPGVFYTFIPTNQTGNSGYAIPGLIRNEAAKCSKGDYLYNSDGDIVYSNPFYFAEILELIKTGNDTVLYRPPMRRLPIEDFNGFREFWEQHGLPAALDILDLSEEFSARMPGSSVSIIPFRKKESGRLKTFLYSSSDLKKYQDDPGLKGSEPKYSTLSVHAGGTFMGKKQFLEVGGFCKQFTAWGCHDADLQWKLKGRFNLFEFPNFPEYEVLHLDHERGYFDKSRWQSNREIQQARRLGGVDAAIAEDLKNGI